MRNNQFFIDNCIIEVSKPKKKQTTLKKVEVFITTPMFYQNGLPKNEVG